MMVLIASIIFGGSVIGMGTMLYQKIPALVKLSEVVEKDEKKNLILVIKNKVKEIDFIKDFSYEMFLQKILSKIRILTLKTDSKTSNWLQKLREKSKNKKVLDDDKYWDELGKSTKK